MCEDLGADGTACGETSYRSELFPWRKRDRCFWSAVSQENVEGRLGGLA